MYPRKMTHASFVMSCQIRVLSTVVMCLFLFMPEEAAWGWARHDVLTQLILEEPPEWVRGYRQVKVNENRYHIGSLNPKFELVYHAPAHRRHPFLPADFVSYCRYPDRKYGFRGVPIGGEVSGSRVLIDFSDEPDWGMDEEVEEGSEAEFMGGSQGYRHMYYPSGTFHLPRPFFPQGKAPERAELFYQYAREAFGNGDPYWGLRFLARAIHYLEDLANPFHTVQISTRFLVKDNLYEGTVQAVKNYHFAYEDYVAYLLVQALRGEDRKEMLVAIRKAKPKKILGTRGAAKELALFSHREGACLLELSASFFGKEFLSGEPVYLDPEKVRELEESPIRDEVLRVTSRMLIEMSSVVKGFLEMAGRELDLGNTGIERGKWDGGIGPDGGMIGF